MSCSSKKEMDLFELRIVLLGNVRAGKSFLGNKILGKEDLFLSTPGPNAVTEKSQKEQEVKENQTVVVVDTPGLLNAKKTEEEIMTEIQKSIKLCEPGPHVFLFVLHESERYTFDVKDKMKRIFGKNVLDYTMVLFNDEDKKIKSIKDFIKGNLKELLKKCKYGYHVFDGSPEQVPELLIKLNDKVKAAKGRHYTAEMLQEHELQQVQNADAGLTQSKLDAIKTAVSCGVMVGGLLGYMAYQGPITATIAATLGALGGGLLCLALACAVKITKEKCKCCKSCCVI